MARPMEGQLARPRARPRRSPTWKRRFHRIHTIGTIDFNQQQEQSQKLLPVLVSYIHQLQEL
eukprot:2591241-Prorocentrum_lima.AAC.1